MPPLDTSISPNMDAEDKLSLSVEMLSIWQYIRANKLVVLSFIVNKVYTVNSYCGTHVPLLKTHCQLKKKSVSVESTKASYIA